MLLHISSLPGPYACGDLGKSAENFVDLLARSGQTWWQTLPIGPIGDGNSPYSSISTFAGEALFVSQEGLYRDGLISRGDLVTGTNSTTKTSYQKARRQKNALLAKAFERFQTKGSKKLKSEFKNYVKSEKSWLEDFSVFEVLAKKHGQDWCKWPLEFKKRDKAAINDFKKRHRSEVEFSQFIQFQFQKQWIHLKKFAKTRGVRLMGDIPIFVAHGSADVWSNQEVFYLNSDGSPKYIAGCPPDKFCPQGQMWGNALYKWDQLEKQKFKWWMARFDRLLELYDAIRLDHFIGFHRFWRIPSDAKTAEEGKWIKAGGDKLFKKVMKKYPECPFIAEDLGKVTQGVWDLRDKYKFPGMKIMQFAFADGATMKVHKAHRLSKNSVIYSGTHDNDTANGWYQTVMKERPSKHEKESIRAVFSKPREVGMDMIKMTMMSPSNTVIFPVQDALNLSSQHRMNIPGTPKGNWEYRMNESQWGDFSDSITSLRAISITTERNGL